MAQSGYSLSSLVENADNLRQVTKSSLKPGNWVLLKTENSIYTVHILEDGYCKVSGGWFDRKGLSPATTRISGCTWGGSTIKMDIAAACGLCLEFGNRLVTTTIRKIVVLPGGCEN